MKLKNQKALLELLNQSLILTNPTKGLVYGIRDGHKILKSPRNIKGHISNGYLRTGLMFNQKRYDIFIHHIIYVSVYGLIPCFLQIDHKNNNKLDNRISNLQLLTQKKNTQKANIDGLLIPPKGEINGQSKLTNKAILRVRKLYHVQNYKQKELSAIFKVSQSCISFVVNKKRWQHI